MNKNVRPYKMTEELLLEPVTFFGPHFRFIYLLSGHWQLSAVVPPLEAEAGVHAGIRPIDVLSQRRFRNSGNGFSLISKR